MFKKIVLGLLLVIIGLALLSFFLPRQIEVARETTIDAPPDQIFAIVNNLKNLNDWSPWAAFDPDAQYTYGGPEEGGLGQTLSWASEHPNVGNGTQEIIESVPNTRVATALDFGDMGQGQAAFDLVPEGRGTKVTWSFETDMGMNPIGRYMGLMMDRWIGTDYERGLANLKALVEGS